MASETIPGGVGAELEDPRRHELIKRLDQAICGEDDGNATCAQEVWAALWLCPLDRLEEYVRQIEISPASLAGVSLYTEVVHTNIVKPWLTTRGVHSPRYMSAAEADGKKAALQRDRNHCIITKTGGHVESAYIHPYSLRWRSYKCDRFWTTLMFWPETVIKDWQRTGADFSEGCDNRITLSPDAHAYYRRCLFALKPVALSQDDKCLELEFHWLRPESRSLSPVFLTTKPSLPESLEGSGEDTALWAFGANVRICSGHRILLETDDPRERPLPSISLLQVQWFVQRLVALSGAAEIYDGFSDDEDRVLNEMEFC